MLEQAQQEQPTHTPEYYRVQSVISGILMSAAQHGFKCGIQYGGDFYGDAELNPVLHKHAGISKWAAVRQEIAELPLTETKVFRLGGKGIPQGCTMDQLYSAVTASASGVCGRRQYRAFKNEAEGYIAITKFANAFQGDAP